MHLYIKINASICEMFTGTNQKLSRVKAMLEKLEGGIEDSQEADQVKSLSHLTRSTAFTWQESSLRIFSLLHLEWIPKHADCPPTMKSHVQAPVVHPPIVLKTHRSSFADTLQKAVLLLSVRTPLRTLDLEELDKCYRRQQRELTGSTACLLPPLSTSSLTALSLMLSLCLLSLSQSSVAEQKSCLLQMNNCIMSATGDLSKVGYYLRFQVSTVRVETYFSTGKGVPVLNF